MRWGLLLVFSLGPDPDGAQHYVFVEGFSVVLLVDRLCLQQSSQSSARQIRSTRIQAKPRREEWTECGQDYPRATYLLTKLARSCNKESITLPRKQLLDFLGHLKGRVRDYDGRDGQHGHAAGGAPIEGRAEEYHDRGLTRSGEGAAASCAKDENQGGGYSCKGVEAFGSPSTPRPKGQQDPGSGGGNGGASGDWTGHGSRDFQVGGVREAVDEVVKEKGDTISSASGQSKGPAAACAVPERQN